jgi:hypothetical protein
MRNTLALASCGVIAAGCFGGSSADLSSLSTALMAASSIGHAASLTVGSMSSGGVVCAGQTPACTTYPCHASTSLTLGPQCPLPLGGTGSGTIVVASVWSSAGVGMLDETFVGDGVAEGKIALTQAEGVSVKDPTMSSTIAIAYVGQSVNVGGSQTLAAQSGWAVSVDTRGTADPSDDVYTVNGSQQGAGTAGEGQVAVTGAVLDPACRRNPTAGTATIQQVGTGGGLGAIQEDVVTFHRACDGNADVVGTLGGKSSVALRFFAAR